MRTIGFFVLALLIWPIVPGYDISLSSKEACFSIEIPAPSLFHPIDALKRNKKDVDTNELKQSSWYAEVARNIEASEYEIKPAGKNLFASPNRKQNLRASFTADRFILEPREKNDWRLELQVKGVYSKNKKLYSPALHALAIIEKNIARFDHNDEFVVEYINSKEGVRQNFIIEKEPVSRPPTITIKLQSNKGWLINQVHPTEIHFAKARNEHIEKKLTYNDLKVWDADNKELEASFAVNKNEIWINVKTEDASYPITIDPISTGTSGTADWTAADADQPNARYGINVASAGDINADGYSDVIVGAFTYDEGANGDEGRAFVYHGSATGLSLTPNSILDDADQPGAQFGIVVNTAGDVNGDGYSDVIVAAHGYDDGTNIDEGRAFIYHGSATGLSASPVSLIDDMDQAGASLGYINGASTAGDVNGDGYSDVIVGARLYDDAPYTDEGRALVYYGSATGISASPDVILNSTDQAGALFGFSVASAGDINGDGYSDVIVSAVIYDGSIANEGAAFIYFGSSSGLSAVPDDMVEDGDQASASFGLIVNSAGDVNGDGYSDVLIGAYTYDDGPNTNEGRVFVYYGSATGLSATADNIIDDANQANAGLGIRAASAGDINGDGYSDVIVGVYQYTEGANTAEGHAYIYLGSASGLAASPNAIIDDADQANANLGSGATSAGDVNGDGYSDIIVGAWFYTDGGNSQEGRAYVYHGGPDGLSSNPINTPDDADQAGANFGVSVASAGDINGDGYSDVIIGAWLYDAGNTNEGVAFVYHGSATGLSATYNIMLDGANQDFALFGETVASAGDVNGDGYSDIIIGADGYDDAPYGDEGRVFVYHGSATGLSSSPDWVGDDANQAGAYFGVSMASAGDVNGDGYGDVIVGAIGINDGPYSGEGRAYVYYGSATGLSASPDWIGDDADQAGAAFGWNVAGAGDVNGDGYSDVIIGALYYDETPNTNEGRAFVYHGSSAGLSLTPNSAPDDADQAFAQFGECVAAAGDVNGDGYSDIIIGAKLYDDAPYTDEGRVFVYHGGATGLSASPISIRHDANQSGAHFGISVASAGDVNGDGYSDVIVGARYYDDGSADEGVAFVYYGSSTGLSTSANSTPDDANQASADFGYTVAGAGDINGDGYSDIIVGAHQYDGGTSNEGQAFVYYGNNSGGKRNNLRLYNSDLITLIQQSNMSDPNLFGAGLYAKSFLGKQKGKLVHQTVKNGVAFTGSPITNSTAYTSQQVWYTDLGLNGTELKSQVAKQIPAKATYIRARVKYDPVTAITGQVYGPWRYPEGFLRGKRDVGSVALPVKFISFTAVKENRSAKLKWITTNEEPGVRFEIQHSIDGINFNSLGMIAGNGRPSNEYTWTHMDPSKGKNFYRVKATENNRKLFTDVRLVHFDELRVTRLFPNPATGGHPVTIENNAIKAGQQIAASLFNMMGQIVFETKVQAVGDGRLLLNIPAISEGNYLLLLRSGDFQGETKILVKSE